MQFHQHQQRQQQRQLTRATLSPPSSMDPSAGQDLAMSSDMDYQLCSFNMASMSLREEQDDSNSSGWGNDQTRRAYDSLFDLGERACSHNSLDSVATSSAPSSKSAPFMAPQTKMIRNAPGSPTTAAKTTVSMTQLFQQQRCQALPDWDFSLTAEHQVEHNDDAMDCGISW